MTWLFLCLLACSEPPPAPEVPETPDLGPDVLLITIDTLRADRVGAYGDAKAVTPVLDALAAEGALFREAHAVTPLTLPSHASILTGRYPVHHGLRDNAGFRLAEDQTTLAEALQARGYQTAAFVSAFVLDSAWGLDQGFGLYRDPFHPEDVAQAGAFGEVELPSAEVVNAAVAWWKGAKGGPRFAWVHLYDPHAPWEAAAGVDPYRDDVADADRAIARLVDTAGKDALIIVTSDHGEGLWDHGEREHGVLLGRSITRVPLIVRPPGGIKGAATVKARGSEAAARRPQGMDPDLDLEGVPDAPTAARVVETVVSGVDIAPTIAAWTGASLSPVDGRSLKEAVEGVGIEATPVYAETWFPWFHYGWASLHMAQDEGHRQERGLTAARYAWLEDPAGIAAVDEADPTLDAVITRLKGEGIPSPGEVDPTTAQALEALGYLTGGPAVVPEDVRDPRLMIDVITRLQVAERLPPAQAVPALRELIGQEPQMADARISLSLALVQLGQLDQAWEENEAVLAAWPEHPLALSNAGVLAKERGDTAKALAIAETMRTLNPHDPRGYRLAAAIAVEAEDARGVLEITRAGLEMAPEDPNLHYLRALAEVQIGDPAVALTSLESARKFGSRAGDIDMWLGVANERAGRIDAAVVHYREATRTMPEDPRPWAMAGWMLYQADRCTEALPFLVNVAKRGLAQDPRVNEALQRCQGPKPP